MNTRIKTVFIVTIVLAVLVAACAPSATPTKPPVEKKKVALMVPGLITDKSWCQFGYEGLVRASEDCDLEIAYSEDVSQDEHDETIRGYIAEGFDMVIGHGGEYEESLITMANEYPDVEFGCCEGHTGGPSNMAVYFLSTNQRSYLAGVLAGLMTKTNRVAYVFGQIFPSSLIAAETFETGARTSGKDIEVTVIATGSWSDVSKARETGLAVIDDGVDVIYHLLDAADAGLISAAEDRGVMAIGLYRDQSDYGPNSVIASTLGSPAVEVYRLACGMGVGGSAPVPVDVNMEDGIDMHFTDLTPPDVQAKILDVLAKMRSGELDIAP